MYDNFFYFLFKFMFLRKNGRSEEKFKLITPASPRISAIVHLPAFNLVKEYNSKTILF